MVREICMKLFLRFRGVVVLSFMMAGQAVLLEAQIVYMPLTALQLAGDRASSINCVDHLKQAVLAAKIWSYDNDGPFPSGFQLFTNELGSPGLLFCPADLDRKPATNWAGLDWSQIDYQWFPQPNWDDPSAICAQCRIHSNYARVDGSVQTGSLLQPGNYRSGWTAIIAPPLDQYATPGSSVQLQVGIAPDALLPLSYQWRRERLSYSTNVTFVTDTNFPGGGYWITNRTANFTVTLLAGETNSSYLIASAQTNASDYYSVAVSNRLGSTASSRARLVVDSSVSSMATNAHWSAIVCVNNLYQIGLFARIWASDHNDNMPSSLSAMTNSFGLPIFGWPVLLFCRADARTAPPDWSGVDFDNTSYEVLPGDSQNPYDVFCRCKIHGFYVQMNGGTVSGARFGSVRMLTNGAAELNFTLFAGRTNILEASADLFNWTNLTTYLLTNGNVFFYDTNKLPRRFYRIRTE